jgi:tetratricopeptide (TPR) repeat protein
MHRATDFQIELERIEDDLSRFGDRAFLDGPVGGAETTGFVSRLFQHASLTGNLAELGVAETAIDRAIERVTHASDLYLLKASIAFELHRLADVRRSLEACATLRDSTYGGALRADLDFQEGRYDRARQGYETVIENGPTWDNLARLAHLQATMGDLAGADRLYARAQDELTAKEMRQYAWVELERGGLDLSRGGYEEARVHYERADRAYSGYWLVEEHMAELLSIQGKLDQAVALYERVVARVPRPEFQQVLGELCELTGRSVEAEAWLEKACAAYLESAARGEVHYYHHLADFYADVREDGAESVRWALEDLELRENFSTQATLAWALYRDRRFVEARDLVDRALASGAKDARLFYRAGMIHRAAGGGSRGDDYLRMAAEWKPLHQSFHVRH